MCSVYACTLPFFGPILFAKFAILSLVRFLPNSASGLAHLLHQFGNIEDDHLHGLIKVLMQQTPLKSQPPTLLGRGSLSAVHVAKVCLHFVAYSFATLPSG